MKLSKRGEYALRAVIDIGMASQLGRPLVRIGDLAERESLPLKFLEKILMQLKEAGYVESKRGKLGGYLLAMPAHKIKFGDVVRLIDGPQAPVLCLSTTAYARCTCPDEEHCGLRMVMRDVHTAILTVLDGITLADVVGRTLRKIRRDRVPIPFIEGVLGRLDERQRRKPGASAKKKAGSKALAVKSNATKRKPTPPLRASRAKRKDATRHKPAGRATKSANRQTSD